jgi:hypothetical protein
MSDAATWHGDQVELGELRAAIRNNCGCDISIIGMPRSVCAPHRALDSDQRWLDGLLAMRHIRDQLNTEEHTGEDQAA